jgi:ligand-binding sensor domain-containing protein
MPDESIVISNTDVNAILNIGSTMYFGTMYGLLYLDLYNRDWNLIDASNGLNDSAVWDMVEYDGSIFVATANGVNEISIINHTIIPDRTNRFEKISRFNIYDMKADSQNLYLASDAGLLQLNWEGGEIKTLSKKDIRKIRLEESGIVGTDGTLWSINGMDDEKYITSNVQDFDICGSYVWSTQGSQVTLLDTITAQTWEYSREDGIPGNKIYGVNCDDDWVWFLTNKGVAFYNWSRYHNKEN